MRLKSKSIKVKETDIQKAFFQYVKVQSAIDERWTYVVGFPQMFPFQNYKADKSNHSSFIWLAHLKALGQKKDFPDIIVFYPIAPFFGMAIELKTEHKKEREGQRIWIDKFTKLRYFSKVVSTNDAGVLVNLVSDYFNKKLSPKNSNA